MRNVLAAAFLALPVAAPATPAAASAPTGCAPVTPAAVAAFFDGTLPGALAADRVPGAVVSVVSGGRTVFAKGYGLADAEDRVPFDPDRSLVRIASITKLFTWTAVMQQVEAGRLDLSADVNRYLTAFKVPATFPRPVTLLDLMDHTSGFEDRVVDVAARTAADVPELGRYLADHMPARVRPPGEVSSYSNYGAALAGYIVSRVTGEPWDRYVEEHILAPLGITHSTATEPVPAALAGDATGNLARSYDSDTNPPTRIPFEFDPQTPDGAISATADDMARFMILHLDGRPDGILSPATLAAMHERSFAADPRLNGYAHGFEDRIVNGHRTLGHDGSWEGFESAMTLVPGCDLGLFVSTNGTGGIDAVTSLLTPFFDRFTPPGATPDPVPVAGHVSPATTATPGAGFYVPARFNQSTYEKLLTLTSQLRLTVDGDGRVHFGGATWALAGDGLYHKVGGDGRLTFRAAPGGRFYAVTDGPTYRRLSGGETLPVNLAVLAGYALLALTALALPTAALWRRLRHRPRALPAVWRAARTTAAAATTLGLAFLVGLGAVLFGDTGDFLYGTPARFTALLVLALVALVAGVAATAATVVGWRGSGAGVLARVHQIALLAALVGLAWFLWQWNLIGWA